MPQDRITAEQYRELTFPDDPAVMRKAPRRGRKATTPSPAPITRTAWQPAPGDLDRPITEVVGPSDNPPRKTRQKRTKAERLTNPYEWEIQRATVTLLRRYLADGYLVQAHVQEREGDARLWAYQQGQDSGWPDIEVTGDGESWLIEMKDRDGDLNAAQKKLHPRLIRAGRKLLPICRSPIDAAWWLRAQGARFKAWPHG